MSAPHTHADIELNFVSKGEMHYRHGGVEVTLAEGDLGIFWGGIPHQLLRVNRSDVILITLPILWLLRWEIPGTLASRFMAGEMIRFSVEEALFVRWLADAATKQPTRHRAMRLELEAMFHRISTSARVRGPCSRNSARKVARGRGLRIEQVTGYLALHYREELSLAQIAREVSLHPGYLARAFKAHCGLSVWEYLTRLRVAHAQRLLRGTDGKIVDVALESGFSSLAPFYAAFARYAGGLSPGGFRRQGHRVLTR